MMMSPPVAPAPVSVPLQSVSVRQPSPSIAESVEEEIYEPDYHEDDDDDLYQEDVDVVLDAHVPVHVQPALGIAEITSIEQAAPEEPQVNAAGAGADAGAGGAVSAAAEVQTDELIETTPHTADLETLIGQRVDAGIATILDRLSSLDRTIVKPVHAHHDDDGIPRKRRPPQPKALPGDALGKLLQSNGIGETVMSAACEDAKDAERRLAALRHMSAAGFNDDDDGDRDLSASTSSFCTLNGSSFVSSSTSSSSALSLVSLSSSLCVSEKDSNGLHDRAVAQRCLWRPASDHAPHANAEPQSIFGCCGKGVSPVLVSSLVPHAATVAVQQRMGREVLDDSAVQPPPLPATQALLDNWFQRAEAVCVAAKDGNGMKGSDVHHRAAWRGALTVDKAKLISTEADISEDNSDASMSSASSDDDGECVDDEEDEDEDICRLVDRFGSLPQVKTMARLYRPTPN